jgi:hypothetical protein
MFLTIPYRFPAWLALTMFSLISILAMLDERNNNWYFEAKWSVALASISFGVGAIVCILQLVNDARDKFVATKVEGSVILLLVIVWVLAIPVIMSPSHGLAMEAGKIVDSNLYFSSWAAFCSSLFMFASYGRSIGGRLDSFFGSRWWLCLFISSCITMTAAIRLKNSWGTTCRDSSGREQCQELRLGIILSIASMAIAIGMIFLGVSNTSLPQFVGVIAGLLVLTAWSVCVARLTFGRGPGSPVGTLFFGTWISFFLALYLALSHLFGSCHSVEVSTSSSSPSQSSAAAAPAKKKKASKKDTKPESAQESPNRLSSVRIGPLSYTSSTEQPHHSE